MTTSASLSTSSAPRIASTGVAAHNTGLFTDLSFKHPNFAIYGHARIQTGDYAGLSAGIGVRF